MRKFLFLSASIAFAFFGTSAAVAQDALYVEINEGQASALKIGVPEISSGFLIDGRDAASALAEIVRYDLGTSVYYDVLPSSTFSTADDNEVLRALVERGGQALLIGRATVLNGEVLRYSCSLYDVFSGELQVGREFEIKINEWRRAGHKCADMVYLHTTGYSGHFDTRFTTVSAELGSQLISNVVAVDFDGVNSTELLRSDELVGMLDHDPASQRLVVMAYEDDVPVLWMVHQASRQRTRLRLPTGLPSAPSLSPDGEWLAFALSENSGTDIYEMQLATGNVRRLTDTTGIDTSPEYSPDGSLIAFESDRSGSPQLYVMRRDGSELERLTYGMAHSSPSWSPDGGRLSYVQSSDSGSRIGIMMADGTGSRVVTTGPHDEDPSFAPSGRAVSFLRTSPIDGTSQLWFVALAGGREVNVASGSLAGPSWEKVYP